MGFVHNLAIEKQHDDICHLCHASRGRLPPSILSTIKQSNWRYRRPGNEARQTSATNRCPVLNSHSDAMW